MVEVDKSTSLNRVGLTKESSSRIDGWLSTINDKMTGMVSLTRTDLVNWLISNHDEKLSEEEIRKIGRDHFNEVRWLNWAVSRLKAAKKAGETLSMEDLLKAREVLFNGPIKAQRGWRKKSQAKQNAETENSVITQPHRD